jgi:hypothetical protein
MDAKNRRNQMTRKYIAGKTTKLYQNVSGGSQNMVLIYGDEVEVTGPPQPVDATTSAQRTPVTFRQRQRTLFAVSG